MQTPEPDFQKTKGPLDAYSRTGMSRVVIPITLKLRVEHRSQETRR